MWGWTAVAGVITLLVIGALSIVIGIYELRLARGGENAVQSGHHPIAKVAKLRKLGAIRIAAGAFLLLVGLLILGIGAVADNASGLLES